MDALRTFLTEENIRLHKDYLRQQKLRYSILEKSIPEIKGKSITEIHKMNLKKSLRAEILPLMQDIAAHETYFHSFSKESSPCKALKKYYSSEAGFCYELFQLARAEIGGFLFVFLDNRARPVAKLSSDTPFAYVTEQPVLALDLCEHAYFADYGFDRDEYLRRAIASLNLAKLCE